MGNAPSSSSGVKGDAGVPRMSEDDPIRPNHRNRSQSYTEAPEDDVRETTGLYIVDEEDDQFQSQPQGSKGFCARMASKVKKVVFAENWFFLIVLGIVAALVAFGVDAGIYYLYVAQTKLVYLMPKYGLSYFMWVVWSIVFAVLAILPIILISPYASGSGIPEMKCILSGIEMNRFLNFRTLVSKCIGLIFAYSSGLSIGKEGPFVHISSIVCSLLTKLPFFKYIRRNNAAYMQVLSAASAVGVTSAFGTAVGGVFFSMEVTSTFYHVENLWRAFFVSVTAKLISVVLRMWTPFGLDLFETVIVPLPYNLPELAAFGIMGILFGILSGIFVRLLTLVFKLSRIHERLQTSWGQLVRVVLVCFVISLIAFPFKLMRNDTGDIIEFLSRPSLSGDIKTLVLLTLAKFVLTLFSVAFTGASAGVFGPVFLEGAIMGRLFGEIVALIFPNVQISPGAYSIVGAAAFASGVTRTISTAVIVVELTSQVHLLLPVLLSVLFANFFGRLISASVYAVLIQAKDLPQMPRFKLFSQNSSKVAGEIMRTDVLYLNTTATYAEVAKLVHSSDYPSFPLVDEDGIFFGVVRRAKLTSVLKHAGIKYHKLSIGSIGQKVIERAKKQWDEHNSTRLTRDMHLEPEDIEAPISLDSPPSEGFGRKADLAKRATVEPVPASSNPLANLPVPSSERFNILEDDPNSLGDLTLLQTQIPLVFSTQNADKSVVDVDSSVLTISPDATVTKVHFMFTVLGLSHLFVVRRGKLLGIITRKDLIKAINSMTFERT